MNSCGWQFLNLKITNSCDEFVWLTNGWSFSISRYTSYTEMVGPSVFPERQVISKWLVLQYFQIQEVYQNDWIFNISRYTGLQKWLDFQYFQIHRSLKWLTTQFHIFHTFPTHVFTWFSHVFHILGPNANARLLDTIDLTTFAGSSSQPFISVLGSEPVNQFTKSAETLHRSRKPENRAAKPETENCPSVGFTGRLSPSGPPTLLI